MNKPATGNRVLIKVISIALALTFGASLMATEVMANSGCSMQCCGLSKPMTRHHTTHEQIRSSMDCCCGPAQTPCDLASATAFRLLEISLASSGGHMSTAAGATGTFSDDLIDRNGLRGHAFDQFAREKFPSPPLYLQNLSFLI